MKKVSYFISLVLAVALLSSCGGLNKMLKEAGNVKYQVEPEVLEAHSGNVDVTITGSFPESYFNKKATLEAVPVLVYEGGETKFESVSVQGEDVEANNEVIKFTGDNFTYSATIPFKEEMRVSELILKTSASMSGKSVVMPDVKLADGVVATSTLTKKPGHPILIGDMFKRVIPESKGADIHYVINQANVRGSELKAEDINALKAYLKEANEKVNYKFTGTEISAYASPDGPLDLNEKLSGKRAETAGTFFNRELKKAKIEEAGKEGFVKTTKTAEDWDGFKELIQKSDVRDKELILRVLSMHSDPVVREKEIKNMSEAFEVLKDDILPKLRRSKLIVNAEVVGFSDEEILNYIENNPDTLGLEEMLYAATLTEDAEKQLKYYGMASEKAPKCFRAVNGMGYTLMKMGKIEESEKAFIKAQELKDGDYVKNNLGFVALVQGDLEKAQGYFTSMEKLTDESNFGLGTINLFNGNYQDAVNYFGTNASFNAALAKLLNGNTTGAKSTLEAIDHKCPWGDYLKAVVGARMDDENYMIENLRAAVAAVDELKALAKTDMEFGKYFENAAFKAIVE
ncbi:MAG: hypothetical protein HQ543_12150 [Bacteroidetes bacterium]|nr:hypothetical protein [Bacteroidota bacterium]